MLKSMPIHFTGTSGAGTVCKDIFHMKRTDLSLFILWVITSTFALTALGCGGDSKSSKSSSGSSAPNVAGSGTDPGATQDVIYSFRYFEGADGPLPSSSPNFKTDMTIDFTTYNNGKYGLSAKHTDSLCFKSSDGFSVDQANQLISLYSQLKLYVAQGPVTADLGQEYIEIKTKAGITRKFFLDVNSTPVGELYASNPNDLVAFLKSVEGAMAVGCQ